MVRKVRAEATDGHITLINYERDVTSKVEVDLYFLPAAHLIAKTLYFLPVVHLVEKTPRSLQSRSSMLWMI